MTKRIVAVGVMVVLVALVGWREWRRRGESDASRPGRGRVPVEVIPVGRHTVRDAGRFSGSLVPRSSVVVTPRVGGRLDRLPIDIGDTVRRGDLLAVLDSEEYAQQVRQAEAEVEVARANEAEARSARSAARRDLDRVATLREQAIASESELDAAQSRFEAAEARAHVARSQVRQREAGLESVRIRLSYTRIHAAWEEGGDKRVVGERYVHEGAVLRANDPIVSLLDLSELTAVVHAIERDYPKLAVGQRARVTTDAWPGQSFEGGVARIAPLIREASRQARVEIAVPNPEGRLRPGMFVRAEIVYAVHEDVCAVPVSALIRREGSDGVFQPDPKGQEVRFVPVRVGIRDREMVQILEPHLSGSVVTLGQHLLDDGTQVSISQGTDEAEGRVDEAEDDRREDEA